MKILVIGPQHSCTRLFVGLIDVHPSVSYTNHISVPSGGSYLSLGPYLNGDYDKICVVSREPTIINLSNKTDYNIPIEENIAAKACANILSELERASLAAPDFMDKVHFVSFEALLNYGRTYIKSVLSKMGLDPAKYPSKTGIHQPKNADGSNTWFGVELDIKDTNKKYFGPTP